MSLVMASGVKGNPGLPFAIRCRQARREIYGLAAGVPLAWGGDGPDWRLHGRRGNPAPDAR